ncbi:MAG: hypothetical protein RSE41_00865 [Clostridia bacterium]
MNFIKIKKVLIYLILLNIFKFNMLQASSVSALEKLDIYKQSLVTSIIYFAILNLAITILLCAFCKTFIKPKNKKSNFDLSFYNSTEIPEIIEWQYSDLDIQEKLKYEIKKNTKEIFLLFCTFLIILVLFKESLILIALSIIGYIILHLFIKKSIETKITKTGKSIIFNVDTILYEGLTIDLKDKYRKITNINYDNNYIIFSYKATKRGTIDIYVPFEYRYHVNVIIEKYKYLTK